MGIRMQTDEMEAAHELIIGFAEHFMLTYYESDGNILKLNFRSGDDKNNFFCRAKSVFNFIAFFEKVDGKSVDAYITI